jgi:hypothetical protein
MASLQGGGEGVTDLFEEASDCVGHHFGLFGFRRRMGAIKDCNDDDDGNRIGKGKLRVLGAFGDSSELVGSPNGNGGFGAISVSNLNLNSISTPAKRVGNQ